MAHWRTLLLLTSALAASCGSAQTGRTRIDPTLAALIPPGATMLAGVRMDEIRGTSVYQKMQASKRLEQLDEFARQTGVDPRKDVRELLIASTGKDGLVAARGTFHIRELEGAAKTSYKGYTLYARGQAGVALIDSSTALAGNLQAVKTALDGYKAGRNSGPAELLARAREIPPQNQIWSVSSGFGGLLAGRIPDNGNAANFGRILQALENTTAAADLRSGLNGSIVGLCRTEEDAKALGDAVRGLVGLGRLSVPENQPELLRLWDGIKVEQQQRTVKITVAIPQNLTDKLIDMLGTQPGLIPRAAIRPTVSSEPGSRLPESSRRPR